MMRSAVASPVERGDVAMKWPEHRAAVAGVIGSVERLVDGVGEGPEVPPLAPDEQWLAARDVLNDGGVRFTVPLAR